MLAERNSLILTVIPAHWGRWNVLVLGVRGTCTSMKVIPSIIPSSIPSPISTLICVRHWWWYRHILPRVIWVSCGRTIASIILVLILVRLAWCHGEVLIYNVWSASSRGTAALTLVQTLICPCWYCWGELTWGACSASLLSRVHLRDMGACRYILIVWPSIPYSRLLLPEQVREMGNLSILFPKLCIQVPLFRCTLRLKMSEISVFFA